MTPRGAATIELCRLDREELSDARRARCEEAVRHLRDAAGARFDALGRVEDAYRRYTDPKQRYSLAVRSHLDRLIESGELFVIA
jgi:hypothetical protein